MLPKRDQFLSFKINVSVFRPELVGPFKRDQSSFLGGGYWVIFVVLAVKRIDSIALGKSGKHTLKIQKLKHGSFMWKLESILCFCL